MILQHSAVTAEGTRARGRDEGGQIQSDDRAACRKGGKLDKCGGVGEVGRREWEEYRIGGREPTNERTNERRLIYLLYYVLAKFHAVQ